MEWKDVQRNCEDRIQQLVGKRKDGLVKDLTTWQSTIDSNEVMRKIAIEAIGDRYGGKYLKI